MFVAQGANMQISRDGSKVVVELSYLSQQPGGKAFHVRTFRDLQSHQQYDWNMLDASAPCGASTFSGDWGDPFAMSAETTADLAKQNAKPLGSATINGIPTKLMEADTPDGKAQVWVEEKYGLVIKWVMTPKTGQPFTMVEVKQLSLAKPAASIFVLPPACAEAAKAPRVPTEAERIAAETGGNAQDFADAMMPPPSKSACSVALRVVHAGSMEPVTGFQIAIDTTRNDVDHPPHYTMGLGANGRRTFSGGGLHEATAQLRNGVLVIENAPPQFDVELAFGKAGDSSALIYRQCFAPQTALLFVVKNPDKLSDGGDWLWVKSGKYAAGPSGSQAPSSVATAAGSPPTPAAFATKATVTVKAGAREIPLKLEEKVAFLFINAIEMLEHDCWSHVKHPCTMQELVDRPKAVDGWPMDKLTFDPTKTDPNYTYTLTTTGNVAEMADWEVSAVPKRPGLGGFYGFGSSSSKVYYNPRGAASSKDLWLTETSSSGGGFVIR
jgi:hypothetical protein